MYRCYSTSCQLWSFVYVDCSLRIDHADISLNIFQVNKFHLKCKLIFKNAHSFRIPIYRKYRLAIYYLILHWKCWFTVASELWIFDFAVFCTWLVCMFRDHEQMTQCTIYMCFKGIQRKELLRSQNKLYNLGFMLKQSRVFKYAAWV